MAEGGSDMNLGRPPVPNAPMGLPPPSMLPPGPPMPGMPSRGMPQISTPGPPLPPIPNTPMPLGTPGPPIPPMSTPGPPMPPMPPGPPLPSHGLMNLPPPPQNMGNIPPNMVGMPRHNMPNMAMPPQGIPGMIPPPPRPMGNMQIPSQSNVSRMPPPPQGMPGMPPQNISNMPPQSIANMPPPPPPQGMAIGQNTSSANSSPHIGSATPPPSMAGTPPPSQPQGMPAPTNSFQQKPPQQMQGGPPMQNIPTSLGPQQMQSGPSPQMQTGPPQQMQRSNSPQIQNIQNRPIPPPQMPNQQNTQVPQRPGVASPQMQGVPPPQMSGVPPPPMQGVPPPQMQSGPPPSMQGGPPLMQKGPPLQMQGGPPPQLQASGGPINASQMQQMSGPPQRMGGPPQRMPGPPPHQNNNVPQSPSTPTGQPPPASSPQNAESSQTENEGDWQGQESGEYEEGEDGKLTPLMSVKVDNPDDPKNLKPTEVVLPKALEDVLALKDKRAAQFEGDVDDFSNEIEKQQIIIPSGVISTEYADADGESDEENEIPADMPITLGKPGNKLNKNKRKKKRKKQNRAMRKNVQSETEDKLTNNETVKSNKKGKENGVDDVTVEYVPERITIADLSPMYRQFYRVFEIFKLENKPKPSEAEKSASLNDSTTKHVKAEEKAMEDDDDDPEEEKKDDKERLSKRKLKKLTRLSVAELKQLVSRPDVVEMHDVTARDPKLLVQLKAHRNTVQVPRHWCFKRKYLQGKRGIEKPPFDLPAFIKKTGIMEMRESLQEKDEAKSLKAKMRERTRPKMGKIDIDYQKLHDAFFKWQTKPRMTIHGDLYYEGKEFETRLKEKKPGDLSEELRIALGMPVGPNCHKIPPPWLIAQQRYGPPPSYPNLKIPGLNAPIPDGTSFGYHAGGWGKPPVDESGKPLYGDVFGTNIVDLDNGVDEGDIERNTWGELESESEESSEEEEEEGEDLANAPDESGLVTPAEGLVTPSGLTSVPAGMETPDNIELRKKKIEAEMEDNETPVLYQVLPEKRTDRLGTAMMASTHVYDISTVNKAAAAGAHRAQPSIGDREGMVELALDPSELDMDNDAMAQRYEQQMREQQSHLQKEDLSDMLAEHVARQKSKRKRQQADTTKQNKKYKEFKF